MTLAKTDIHRIAGRVGDHISAERVRGHRIGCHMTVERVGSHRSAMTEFHNSDYRYILKMIAVDFDLYIG